MVSVINSPNKDVGKVSVFLTGRSVLHAEDAAASPVRREELHAHLLHRQEHSGPPAHVLPPLCTVRDQASILSGDQE